MKTTILAAALLLPAALRAQAPTLAPPPPTEAPDPAASRACARAHQRAAATQAAQAAAVSGRHRQLEEQYDLQFVRLDLALENNSRAVRGTATLRGQVRPGGAPLDTLAFELYQAPAGSAPGAATLTIDGLTVNGLPAPGLRRRGQEARVALPGGPLPAGAAFEARITYAGTAPNGNSAAIGNAFNTAASYRRAGQTVAYPGVCWSLSEPFSAHEWWPCKQVLTDKLDSAAVVVTTTLPNRVGSNGVLRRTTLLPGNQVRYEWRESYPIAYYLLSVAVAPYLSYAPAAAPLPGGGPAVPLQHFVYDQASLDYWQAEFDRLPGFLSRFSELVGPYPFAREKYGLALAPIGGGMEHQTLTTQDGLTFTLTAHELMHQWFGDHVTCAAWADIWLNEGFASYGEYLALQAFGSPAQPRLWMDDAQARAQRATTGTVRVDDTTSVGRIFDYNLSYKKGAAVVHLLRYLCQDDARFFRVLRQYQQQYGGRTARTADLQRLFEAELGQPLGYFFDQWFRGAGFPRLDVRWRQVGAALALQTAQTASVPASVPFFRLDVEYQLTFQDGSTQRLRLPQTQAQQAYNVPLPAGATVAAVQVDPAGWLPDLPGTVQPDNSLVLSATAPAPASPLTLWPNPAADVLHLGALPAPAARAELTDALGRRVAARPVGPAGAPLDVQSLAPGLYFVRVLDAGGVVLGQGRFVKE